MSAKERTDVKALEKRIRELEKQLQRAQIKNVALNTMIDIAETDYKLEIRKSLLPNSRCTGADVSFGFHGVNPPAWCGNNKSPHRLYVSGGCTQTIRATEKALEKRELDVTEKPGVANKSVTKTSD